MNGGLLKFSVVICTYSLERFSDLIEAIESVSNQQYPNIEIVVVVDGNKDVYNRLIQTKIKAVLHLNEQSLGVTKSRNVGAGLATGDAVAFIDDDAVADPYWISELAYLHQEFGAVAAGGVLKPLWVDGVVDFIPGEYLWLIGSNPKGSPEYITEVRNTYGSNISFARDVFLSLGGFNSSYGFNAGNGCVLQGEEAELCNRVKALTKKGCMYSPFAVVYHKVFKSRTKLKTLFLRAFWQGYSKRALEEQSTEPLGEESNFLRYILFTSVPERIFGLLSMHLWRNLKQLFFLLSLTSAIGVGYVVRTLKGGKTHKNL